MSCFLVSRILDDGKKSKKPVILTSLEGYHNSIPLGNNNAEVTHLCLCRFIFFLLKMYPNLSRHSAKLGLYRIPWSSVTEINYTPNFDSLPKSARHCLTPSSPAVTILSCVWVPIEGVRIGYSIYWPLIHSRLVTTLYRSLTDTQPSVLNLLQSPLAVSWQRILKQEL
jgi:hypothetical protein